MSETPALSVASKGETPSPKSKQLPANNNDAVAFLTSMTLAGLLIAVGVLLAYVTNFREEHVSADPAAWGQFGDYLGGVLNPVFGFLSFMTLVLALALQMRELALSKESLRVSQEELKATREEQAKAAEALALQNRAIQKQSFEQTFFSWLGTYRQVLGEIGYGEALRGRKALYELWKDQFAANEIYSGQFTNWGEDWHISKALHLLALNNFLSVNHEHYSIISQGAKEQWDMVYRRYESDLDSFFRVLYRLLKWIDEQGEEHLSRADKWLYVGIVRSQLSWIEMVFLFYNGMTERGAKFKPLIERYALFDNLTIHSDKLLVILKECPMDSVGYSGRAFDSDIARGMA